MSTYNSVHEDIRISGRDTSRYNATVYRYDEEGNLRGLFVAQVKEINGRLQMLRANGSTHTGFEDYCYREDHPEDGIKEGDAQYDHYYRSTLLPDGYSLVIEKDGTQGYRDFLAGRSNHPKAR